jgi:hypothetical protein
VERWVIFLIIVVILGALAGGKSFGETISKGIGCLILVIIAVLILAAIALSFLFHG